MTVRCGEFVALNLDTYVACMADVITRAGEEPLMFDQLGFVVIAHQYSIEKGTFSGEMRRSSVGEKVRKCVNAYDGE
jgi:hypothetical protein